MSDSSSSIKRFYKAVSIASDGSRYVILLDERRALTPMRGVLSAPSERLAEAVADEWSSQSDVIDRNSMPLTTVLSAAIDGGEVSLDRWREEILEYLGSDLLCYRADAPAALLACQVKAWDPFVIWFHQQFDVELKLTTGIVAVEQPGAAFDQVKAELLQQSPEALCVLRTITALTGSAVLALACLKEAFPVEEIFSASRVDERFQSSRWGVDEEAEVREKKMHYEFLNASRFLSLL